MRRTFPVAWLSMLGFAACATGGAPPNEQPTPRTPSPPVAPPAVAASEAAPVTQGAPTASAAPPLAKKARCADDMVDAPLACVDRFEAPNKKGDKPMLMVNATEAEAWCHERGKRLCTEKEWVTACGGESARPFPYGIDHKDGACNDEQKYRVPGWAKLGRWPDAAAKAEAARLDQSEPAGQREACTTPEGVHDMVANAAEWVVRTETHPGNPPHVVMGCSWTKCFRPPHTPTCDYANYNHVSAWRSYEIGFRCCKDKAD